MKVAILTVGTEILFGQIVNTNAAWLSKELQNMGFDVMYHYSVGDNPGRLEEVLNFAFRDCDMVITTGGLGPTQDDLTKETKQSNKNIFLVGYKEPDKIYNRYNIKINKTIDNLQIIGDFNEDDEVYLILDKFLDKRIYDINSKYTTINKKGLAGKYSIYIKINNTIYKTNNYIKF